MFVAGEIDSILLSPTAPESLVSISCTLASASRHLTLAGETTIPSPLELNPQKLSSCPSSTHFDSDELKTSTSTPKTPMSTVSTISSKREHQISGYLRKQGQKTSLLKKRFYLLCDDILHVYKSKTSKQPKNLIVLSGCFIEPLNTPKANDKKKFGINIISGPKSDANIGPASRILYAMNIVCHE